MTARGTNEERVRSIIRSRVWVEQSELCEILFMTGEYKTLASARVVTGKVVRSLEEQGLVTAIAGKKGRGVPSRLLCDALVVGAR